MPTLGTLAAGLASNSRPRLSEIFITELDDDDRPLPGSSSAPHHRRFQYYPDSISDTKAVNYQTKEVPGGSLPLYQFINSGERNITFTAVFTTDIDHLVHSEAENINYAYPGALGVRPNGDQVISPSTRTSTINSTLEASRARLQAAGAQDRNPYIPGALTWLRRFMLPRYGDNTQVGVPLTKPPHKLLLQFTGTEIERNGGADGFSAPGGGILCIMTQCDITYEALFPTGNPRIVTVSLGFAEVPQRGGAVRFPSAEGLDSVAYDWYWLAAASGSRTGGRSR